MALMKFEQARNVHVADTIAVGHHEAIVGDVLPRALQPASGHGFEARLSQGDAEVLLFVAPVVLNARFLPQADGEIVVHRLIVEEIFLDHVALVSQAQHEITKAVMRVQLHDVPEDWAPSYFDQGLGTKLGFLSHTGSETAAEEYDLHKTGTGRFAQYAA